jgi:hypothetical protein
MLALRQRLGRLETINVKLPCRLYPFNSLFEINKENFLYVLVAKTPKDCRQNTQKTPIFTPNK